MWSPILKALGGWAFLEVTEGWQSWFGFRANGAVERDPDSSPQPQQLSEEQNAAKDKPETNRATETGA